jgi:hypothetical protein
MKLVGRVGQRMASETTHSTATAPIKNRRATAGRTSKPYTAPTIAATMSWPVSTEPTPNCFSSL